MVSDPSPRRDRAPRHSVQRLVRLSKPAGHHITCSQHLLIAAPRVLERVNPVVLSQKSTWQFRSDCVLK
jgi:hypothetical protein